MIRRQAAFGETDPAQYAGKQVIEIVSDAARKDPDALQFLGLEELCLNAFGSLISRAMCDAPRIRPSLSRIGEIVRETSTGFPPFRMRTVSK